MSERRPIRYARGEDGLRIAHTADGVGPPLVFLRPNPLSHLVLDAEVPAFRDLHTTPASGRTPTSVLPATQAEVEAIVLAQPSPPLAPGTLNGSIADLRTIRERVQVQVRARLTAGMRTSILGSKSRVLPLRGEVTECEQPSTTDTDLRKCCA